MFESLFWGPILAVLQFPVFWVVANLFFRWSYLYGHDGNLNSKFFFTDLGALALSRALVGIGERALENECHRFDFHPDWSPTERAMFESLFWGPILAVLQFPVFWWSRKPLFWPKIGPITTDYDGTRGDRIPPMRPTRRYGSQGPGGPKQPKFREKNFIPPPPMVIYF